MSLDFRELNVSDASKKMLEWKEDPQAYLQDCVELEYQDLRESLLLELAKVDMQKPYTFDLDFGIALFAILNQYGFTVREAANDNIWRYISLCVIPDIVGKRWSRGAEIRYYKESNRIWLKTIWWYIYLSWQGTIYDTKEVLKNNSTDTILQLVDRSGRKGYFYETYRRIIYYYYKSKRINPSVNDHDFRRVMVLHTALCVNLEPSLYNGGVDGYVKMLYSRLGINIGD